MQTNVLFFEDGKMNANKDVGKQVFLKLTEEDQLELFGRLRVFWSNTIEVTITIVGEHENRKIVGVVTGLDTRQGLLKVQKKEGWELIELTDVLSVGLMMEML